MRRRWTSPCSPQSAISLGAPYTGSNILRLVRSTDQSRLRALFRTPRTTLHTALLLKTTTPLLRSAFEGMVCLIKSTDTLLDPSVSPSGLENGIRVWPPGHSFAGALCSATPHPPALNGVWLRLNVTPGLSLTGPNLTTRSSIASASARPRSKHSHLDTPLCRPACPHRPPPAPPQTPTSTSSPRPPLCPLPPP
jgi:hypothetical protein